MLNVFCEFKKEILMHKSKSKKVFYSTIIVFILCAVMLLTLGQLDLTKVFASTTVYTKAGEYNLTGNYYVTADCTQMPTFGKKVFTIDTDVSYAKFIGNGSFLDSFHIAVKFRTTELDIILVNMNFRGPLDSNAINIANTKETVISIEGTCKVEGGPRTTYLENPATDIRYAFSNGIFSLTSMTSIIGEGNTFTLIGGMGFNGAQGGCGFLGPQIHLYMACLIKGGKGGAGLSGDAGKHATDYGVRGGDGGNGQNGGEGGTAIDAEKVYIYADNVVMWGGDGGRGGNGGKGGNGYRGKNGALFVSPIAGTNGGNGGNGGEGGNRGEYFNGYLYHIDTNFLNSIFPAADGKWHSPRFEVGEYGVGGNGGDGGNGGNGSLSMAGNKKNNQGQGGQGGQGGKYRYIKSDYSTGTAYGQNGANGANGKP